MDKDNKPEAAGIYACHLGIGQYKGDSRTPEERAAAESRESARRKGRGRKDWWKADEKKGGQPEG